MWSHWFRSPKGDVFKARDSRESLEIKDNSVYHYNCQLWPHLQLLGKRYATQSCFTAQHLPSAQWSWEKWWKWILAKVSSGRLSLFLLYLFTHSVSLSLLFPTSNSISWLRAFSFAMTSVRGCQLLFQCLIDANLTLVVSSESRPATTSQ